MPVASGDGSGSSYVGWLFYSSTLAMLTRQQLKVSLQWLSLSSCSAFSLEVPMSLDHWLDLVSCGSLKRNRRHFSGDSRGMTG